ncbi:SDR family NAD(P)-dependent oxidoreductase [Burkholderiaceae bacterium DAT-1]|nr:SDR family NAD(P)-dependent oxidoreductase [Burkholderiaceae bacterium DAT-1]
MFKALITGATGGYGRALARYFAGQGWHLYLHGRDAGKLAQLKLEVQALGGTAETLCADMTHLSSLTAMAFAIQLNREDHFYLLNNAGMGFEAAAELTADGYEQVWQVNFLAAAVLCRCLLPRMAQCAHGEIINIASAGQYPLDFDDLDSRDSFHPVFAYGRSKAAMIMDVKYLAAQHPAGICINAIHPASLMPTALLPPVLSPQSTLEQGVNQLASLLAATQSQAFSGQYWQDGAIATSIESTLDISAIRCLGTITDAVYASLFEEQVLA